MNEHIILRNMPSVVSEPDYVGPGIVQRNPIKLLIATLIASLAICGISSNLLASYMTPLAHVFWLFFHVFYIGGLVHYFANKQKLQSREVVTQ